MFASSRLLAGRRALLVASQHPSSSSTSSVIRNTARPYGGSSLSKLAPTGTAALGCASGTHLSRGFSTAAMNDGNSESKQQSKSDDSKTDAKQENAEGEQKGSDERKAESGEYDTQGADKRIGNPLSWANPVSGPTMDAQSSPKWKWVYPVGGMMILLGCLWSRRKNIKKQKEEELLKSSDLNMGGFGAPGRFTAPPTK